ncbi:MAG TPA: ATP-binding protein [Polyangia bacterium]|nr:ATP-binding protein [Polyangia bacterium]
MTGSRSVRPRAGRVFLAAAVAVLAVAGLSAVAVSSYATSTEASDHALEVLRQIYEWQGALVDAETGVRGYVASNERMFLEPYTAALPGERRQAAVLRLLLDGRPSQLSRLDQTERDARLCVSHLGDLVALVNDGRRAGAVALLASGEGKRLMDSFRRDAAAMTDGEVRALEEYRARSRVAARTAVVESVALTVFACVILLMAWRRERAYQGRTSALAEEARRRLGALSKVAAALAESRTRAQVATVVVDEVVRATGADTCTLYELDVSGTALELTAERGVAPEVLEQIRRISETEGNSGALASMRAERPVWAEDDSDYARIYPALAATQTTRPRARAFWSVPLVAESAPLGLLGVGYYAPTRFSPEERAFVETLSGHCAQALLRATRLEREDEARRWLATTLRSIGDAVIATDAAGRVTFMNPIAETLTGWPEAEARDKPLEEIFSILSEQTRAVVESPVVKVLREGKVVGLANHTLLRSRQGVERPIDDSGAPIRLEGGAIAGVVLVFRDASAEKRARVRREFLARAGEALVSSIDYEAILTTVARLAVPTLADWCSVDLLEPGARASRQVAVAHVDEHKVRFARELGESYPPNPDARTGVPEVIRTGKSELYPEIPRDLLERAARDDEHLRLIRDLQLESGMVVPLRVRGRTFGALTFIYAESKRRYGHDDLSFAEDFARRAAMAIENAIALKETENARVREQVLRSEAELANRAKDEFLATVSHELRTPLSAIMGWATLLLRRDPPPDLERGLSTIERNARIQAKLIDDVLDISRIIGGKLVLNIGAADLGEVIAAAIETVTPAANLKNITIANERPLDALKIVADADRLQQVVWNLIANSVKFTPKGGTVTVQAGREGSDVWIRVHDDGEGIRRDLLPVIFEPFRQADASTTRRHGGLGLGLAIVRQLVLAHGGTVQAESDGGGRGATFTVRLPARAVVPVIGTATAAAGPTESFRRPEDVPRLDGVSVLLVEDEPDGLGMLNEILTDLGARVRPVPSARQALDELARAVPDVLVSDIGMPEMDGISLIQRVRALPMDKGGGTRAIALTAFARVEDVQRALGAGYQMHVAKPAGIGQLARAIADVVRGTSGLDAPLRQQ